MYSDDEGKTNFNCPKTITDERPLIHDFPKKPITAASSLELGGGQIRYSLRREKRARLFKYIGTIGDIDAA